MYDQELEGENLVGPFFVHYIPSHSNTLKLVWKLHRVRQCKIIPIPWRDEREEKRLRNIVSKRKKYIPQLN